MQTLNVISLERLSPAERAAELTALLAAALVRTAGVASGPQSAVGLGFTAESSVHATPHLQERL